MMSDGCEGGDDSLESSVSDVRARALNADGLISFDERPVHEEEEHGVSFAFGCAFFFVSTPSVFGSEPCSSEGLGGAPNAKKGGRKDPGREAREA